MLIWDLKFWVGQIIWGLKFRSPKSDYWGSEIYGTRDYLESNISVPKNLFTALKTRVKS